MFSNHNLIDIKKHSVHVEDSEDILQKRLTLLRGKTSEWSSIDVNQRYVNIMADMNFVNKLHVS